VTPTTIAVIPGELDAPEFRPALRDEQPELRMAVLKSREAIQQARAGLVARGLSFTEGPRWEELRHTCKLPRLGDPVKSWDVLRTLTFIEARLPTTARILDLGAYCSEIPCILHEAGYRNIAGVDLNPELPGMPFAEDIEYRIANFHYTNFPDASFDAITAVSVIEHGFDGSRLLKEVSRLLKPGGWFIASVDYWPDKLDTSGKTAFDLSWTIFSEAELRAFFAQAEPFGMGLRGPMDFAAGSRAISWNDREYTFGWFALQKAPFEPAAPVAGIAEAAQADSRPLCPAMIPGAEPLQPIQGGRAQLAFLSTFNQACGIAAHTASMMDGVIDAAQGLGVDMDLLVLAEDRDGLLGVDPPWVHRCWNREGFDSTETLAFLAREGVNILHVQFQAGLFLNTDLLGFLRACRKLGIRLFGTFHSMENHLDLAAEAVNLMDRAFVHLDQGALRFIAHGAQPDRLRVVPLGASEGRCSLSAAKARQALGLPEDLELITSFGFFEPHKGVLEIIRALPEVVARHPKVQFAFLGGGHPDNPASAGYIEECREAAIGLGLANHVTFQQGFVPEEEAGLYIAASNVVVLNYLPMRNEISAAAAFVLAHGRPLVTSPTPAFIPLLDCTLQTSAELGLAQAINMVLEKPELAAHLESRARAFLAEILLEEYGLLPDATRPARPSLRELFDTSLDRPSTKWSQYFDIYETYLGPLRDRPTTLLEIGIHKGGSLSLWKQYFKDARIFAVDIEPGCKAFEGPGVTVRIGDQSDTAFLEALAHEAGGFDVVIDDGGHRMEQQIASFKALFPHVRDGGVYLIEDMHTSYMPEYGGGLHAAGSATEFLKSLVDHLTWWPQRDVAQWMDEHLESVHFFDSVCVLVKKRHARPVPLTRPA
jgi:glycosyltransferase involved in cell wall biosynthesis/SAM-dependent methyltransferase/cephalosporin hydroxylase